MFIFINDTLRSSWMDKNVLEISSFGLEF